jgi:glycerophosphoryl diester phosphodiesterase
MSEKYRLPSLFNHNDDGFIVIAHRGASADYPENTMAAFKGAIELNAEMIELDVMMSKDGVPVVFHDAELDDHTNGSGLISNYTLEELKELDAGSWFDSKFANEPIPTLDEVLGWASGKIALNIEIKTEAVSDEIEGGVEEKCLDLVKKHGMEDHVLFSSFDYRAVAHLKKLDPDIPVALLYEKSQSKRKLPNELIAEYNADAFNCSYRQLNSKWMADLREHNIPSFIYTVDRKSRMIKLLNAGVTGIFTNKPDVLNGVVKEYGK